MWLRRGFYHALWGAALILPLWVFLGRAFFGAPLGFQFLAQILIVPLLFIAQIITTLVLFLRASVRRQHAVSWIDVGLLSLLWVGQLGIGFFLVDSAASTPAASAFTALVGAQALDLSTVLSAAAIVLTLAAGAGVLIAGIWQALRDARLSVQRTLADLERSAAQTSDMPAGWANDPEHTIRITPRT